MIILCFANGVFYFNITVFRSTAVCCCWKSTATTKQTSSNFQEVKKIVKVNIENKVLHLAIVLQTSEKLHYAGNNIFFTFIVCD